MKAKKILFKIAGILQFICCGFIAFIGIMLLLLRSVVGSIIDALYEEFQNFATTGEGSIDIDSSSEFLLDYSKEEFVDFFMTSTITFAIVAVAIAIIGIVFGVLFVKYSKNYEYTLANNKPKKILIGVLTGVFCGISIPTLLVIIALCIKDNETTEIIDDRVKINS
jgi:hypothetical protein